MHTTLQKDSPLILIADDDRFTRMLLRQILEQDGYRVREVGDGEQCLAAYMRERPDMVLLDAIMPVMDGFTCCTQLQSFCTEKLPANGNRNSYGSVLDCASRIPVLMITGLNDQDSVDRAFAAGAIDYVTKPIHPPVLRQRLRRLLEASRAEEALRESEKKYRLAVDNLKEVIFQTDTARELIFLNPAWTEITGYSLAESLGKRFLDFFHPDDRLLHWQQFQTLIEGQTEDCCYSVRCLTKKGSMAQIEVYACRMSADDGALLGISGTINDITERKRREQHLNAENATTRVLAEAGMLNEAIPKILQAICENLEWERGEFWSVDSQRQALHCVETWHREFFQDSELEAATAQLSFAPGEGLPGRVWETGEPSWMSNVVENPHFLRGAIAAKVGLYAAFGFPIGAGDETLGVMSFFSGEIQPPDNDLLQVMGAIGSQIGQFIKRKQAEEEVQRQNAVLQSELNQAADYVRSLLPRRLTKGVTVEKKFVPSLQLGGDAFDYRWLDEEHLVVYLLDVAGHGVKSALLSVSVLNVLRSQSLPNTNFYQPSAVLTSLNNVFQMGETGDDYFTIWYGVYHKSKRQLVYASGGHPPAILISDASTVPSVKELGTPSLPIGMLPEADFEDSLCEVPDESNLYLFSDGVYEIHQSDGKIWGLNNFVNLLTDYQKHNTGDLDQVFHYIQNLNANTVLDDDFSLLQIKLR
jgi:phosphoserine phosphatase RsbU/P